MAVLHLVDFGEIFDLEFAALEGRAFDDVNILAKRVFAKNAENERRVFIGKGLLGPFRELSKLVEENRSHLVRRLGFANGLRRNPGPWHCEKGKRHEPFGDSSENMATFQRHARSRCVKRLIATGRDKNAG